MLAKRLVSRPGAIQLLTTLPGLSM